MVWIILVCFILASVFLFFQWGYLSWVVPGAIIWGYLAMTCEASQTFQILLLIHFSAAVLMGVPFLRGQLISRFILPIVAGVLPQLGETERIALEAGTVWWDGDLFSGNPDWDKLLNIHVPELSDEEKAFLEGPVEELCNMVTDWEIIQGRDLPPKVWDFLKKEKFLGMIIPKDFGGLGFSAIGHSAVITKLAGRSNTLAVTVMVPNSLGPAELLLHYGTQEQKDHFLPRLAKGEEVPCFSLTEPNAGSDAAGMQSEGVICKGTYQGEEVLGMRLNWSKRYITLGPIASILGLAFKLKDPDHLIGDQEDLGITCALIPTDTPGVTVGERHDPMGIPFQNGPNHGKNVFVPLSFIIGGQKNAGNGWRMLMESLAAGRSISLPSMSCGSVQLATRVVGSYASIRKQFNMPIGKFEGIEEALAPMGGLTYLMNASRVLTCGAVDLGEKPSVVSAIMKAYSTNNMRHVLNYAYDIQAGAAICRGPRNTLERTFLCVPIGITVEGANILTRSMIIYGQGAIRCHPYVRDEMEGAIQKDIKRFDRAFFKHINFVFSMAARSKILGLTGGLLAPKPRSVLPASLRPYFGKLSRYSASFAFLSDVAMGTLGGTLKRREKITGRYADALSWLYLASATLKYFSDQGQPKEEIPFVQWACEHAIFEIEKAFKGILENFPVPFLGTLLRPVIFPLGARAKPPSDALGTKIAHSMLEGKDGFHFLTRDIFVPQNDEPGLATLEKALKVMVEAKPIEKKISQAIRSKDLPKQRIAALLEPALEKAVISQEEFQILKKAEALRDEVVAVDAFDQETFKKLCG